MSKYFSISGQVLDWLLSVFTKIVSFPFDKILFGLSLLLFSKDSLYLMFLVEYYFDPSFLFFN